MTSSSPTEKVLDDCAEPRRAQRKRAFAVAKLHVDAGVFRDERRSAIGPAWKLDHDSQTLSAVDLLGCVVRDGPVLPPDTLYPGPLCVPDREPEPKVAIALQEIDELDRPLSREALDAADAAHSSREDAWVQQTARRESGFGDVLSRNAWRRWYRGMSRLDRRPQLNSGLTVSATLGAFRHGSRNGDRRLAATLVVSCGRCRCLGVK